MSGQNPFDTAEAGTRAGRLRSGENPFTRSRSMGRAFGRPLPRSGPLSPQYDDDDERPVENTPERKTVSRDEVIAKTGVTRDTLRRWVRDGHLPAYELVPGYHWYNIDEVREVQKQMAARRGGRPALGLGDYQDTNAIDSDVRSLMGYVMLALAVRGATPDASVRAIKRWSKTVNNHPRDPQYN